MRIIPRYSTRCLVITTLVVVLCFLSLVTLASHLNPRSTSKASLALLKALPGNKDKEKLVLHEPPSESGLSLEQLRSLVSGKKGYYVRDWSLGLGWNNMKYIIEASVLQAKLLNRVLVIPSFVYARSCEFENDVCSKHATFVDRQGTVGWGAGRNDNMAWKLPIEIMLDLPRLRFYYPVILTTEFMRLHGLDPSNERITGYWNRKIHTEHSNMTSFHVIPNPSFDDNVFRVDTILPFPLASEPTEVDTQIDAQFREAAGGEKNHLSWNNTMKILRDNGHSIDHDALAEELINRAGWVVTYTYEGQGGKEFAKTVVPPAREILPRARVRGWTEDFTVDADVLLLEGETHLERKPASMRFTTSSARDDYTHFVLSYMHPTSSVIDLSEKLAKRMTRLTKGRGWCAAHMRRGDFIQIGWVKNSSLEAHLKYVKGMFEKGRERLTKQTLWFWNNIPKKDDPYFIATDDRTKESLEFIRKDGAVTIYELLTDEERREIGWPLLFTDVLGLVEQRIAASSAFFYGPALSSLSGGVLNLRTTMGLDSNSWIVD